MSSDLHIPLVTLLVMGMSTAAQEPSSIVSNPLPWTADVAVAVLVSVWGTFQELAGPQKMQAERDAKALRRMLKPNRVASNKEAIEAGHLLLSILQALGPPEPRRTSEIQPSSNVSIKGTRQHAACRAVGDEHLPSLVSGQMYV